MREFQTKPHTQLGFILNLELHWFTLRRFGPAVTDPTVDPGVGHWFNLNSFLSEPEWVSKTYLGMVLQQAEAEGLSIQTMRLGLKLTCSRVLCIRGPTSRPEPASGTCTN